MLISGLQIPQDKLGAYLKGRRDQLKATESTIESLHLAGVMDIKTVDMILNAISQIDQRPKVGK